MTLITKSGIEDVQPTVTKQATKWDRAAVAFARTVALQITEWLSLKKLGVKVWWTIRKIPLKSGSGISVLAVYFYVPLHEIGLSDEETPTLDKVPLSTIVISTAKKEEK